MAIHPDHLTVDQKERTPDPVTPSPTTPSPITEPPVKAIPGLLPRLVRAALVVRTFSHYNRDESGKG